MRLILVRHAEAAPGEPDELRPLTAAGRDTARALGDELSSARLDAVVSSPLLRARETADPIARAAGLVPETDERLAPGATIDEVRAAVAGRGETIAVVGHQPDCGLVARALTGRDLPFPPGGVETFDL